jgi:hypothetical protein
MCILESNGELGIRDMDCRIDRNHFFQCMVKTCLKKNLVSVGLI